jgi:hypothetical protein
MEFARRLGNHSGHDILPGGGISPGLFAENFSRSYVYFGIGLIAPENELIENNLWKWDRIDLKSLDFVGLALNFRRRHFLKK